MKKVIAKIILCASLFSLILPFDSFAQSGKRDEYPKFNVTGADEILISIAWLGQKEDLGKGDEALLITDLAEIDTLVKLFDKNYYAKMHACGYHWSLRFRQAGKEKEEILINKNCEEFLFKTEELCTLLTLLFSKALKTPTHFITNIAVDTEESPEEVKKKLGNNSNYRVFFMEDLNERFPSIQIEATSVSAIPSKRSEWEAAQNRNQKNVEEKLILEVFKLKTKYEILGSTKPQMRGSSFGGGEIKDTYQTTIYFPVGTNLNDIEKSLSNSILKVKKSPTTYFIQLVSTERYSAELKQKLSEEYSFIKDAFAYPFKR